MSRSMRMAPPAERVAESAAGSSGPAAPGAVRGDALRLLTLQRTIGNHALGRRLRRGGGPRDLERPLPPALRATMEAALGGDFTTVRIYEGEQARAFGARAYTDGRDIHVATGLFQPDTRRGRELLGHELAHVVQQAQGRVAARTRGAGAALNDDPALEAEAGARGARAATGAHGRTPVLVPAAPGASAGVIQCARFTLDVDTDPSERAVARKLIQAAWVAKNDEAVEELVEELDVWIQQREADGSPTSADGEYDWVKNLREWILKRGEYRSAEKAIAQKGAQAAADQAAEKKKIGAALKNSSTAKKKNDAAAKAMAKVGAPAAPMHTGSAVLGGMGIAQEVTRLDDVSFRGGVYRTHLRMPDFTKLNGAKLVSRKQVLTGLHITVERYGPDNTDNPRFWVGTGKFTSDSELNTTTRSYLARQGKLLVDALPVDLL